MSNNKSQTIVLVVQVFQGACGWFCSTISWYPNLAIKHFLPLYTSHINTLSCASNTTEPSHSSWTSNLCSSALIDTPVHCSRNLWVPADLIPDISFKMTLSRMRSFYRTCIYHEKERQEIMFSPLLDGFARLVVSCYLESVTSSLCIGVITARYVSVTENKS